MNGITEFCSPCIEHGIEVKTEILSSNNIVNKICDFYHASPSMVLGHLRYKKLVEARHIIAHVLRHDRHLDMSLKSIAFLMNHRDHATIIHAVKKINNYLEVDEFFREKVKSIYLMVYGTLKYYPHWTEQTGF